MKNVRNVSRTVKQKKDLGSLKQDPLVSKALFSPEPKLAQKAQDLAVVQERQQQQQLSCECLCKCFGFFKYDEWPSLDSSKNPLQLPEFGAGDIKILYRDRLKVFFKSAKEAQDAGYSDYNMEERKQLKKDSYLYAFTGLRGDAKQLYLKVKNGFE